MRNPLSVTTGHAANRTSRRRIETPRMKWIPGHPNVAVTTSVGGVDQVVQTHVQSIHAKLRVSLAKPGQDDLPNISPTITIVIAQVPNVRRSRRRVRRQSTA